MVPKITYAITFGVVALNIASGLALPITPGVNDVTDVVRRDPDMNSTISNLGARHLGPFSPRNNLALRGWGWGWGSKSKASSPSPQSDPVFAQKLEATKNELEQLLNTTEELGGFKLLIDDSFGKVFSYVPEEEVHEENPEQLRKGHEQVMRLLEDVQAGANGGGFVLPEGKSAETGWTAEELKQHDEFMHLWSQFTGAALPKEKHSLDIFAYLTEKQLGAYMKKSTKVWDKWYQKLTKG